MSWDVAFSNAGASIYAGLNGYLVTIASRDELNFVSQITASTTVWLAGRDTVTEGVWLWQAGSLSGSVVNPTFWGAGEPNNYGNEDCMTSQGSAWNDVPCTIALPYVVEYDCLPGGCPCTLIEARF